MTVNNLTDFDSNSKMSSMLFHTGYQGMPTLSKNRT